jgi:proteasome lid subunit RPN8/RPN11
LAAAHQSSETGVWSVEGHSIRVEYWASVLDEIRAAAVAGYCQFPRGGVEIGGILFGRLDSGATRIVAFRPVGCEYKFGPSYQLSEMDEQAFAQALRAPESDPLLAGLEPVGWYHSHTRSEVCLSDQDLDLHSRHFPKPEQVALVIRPESFGPSRAGFFFYEADGTIRTESSYGEFALSPRGRKPRAAPKEEQLAPERAERRTAPHAAPPKVLAAAPVSEAKPRRRWVWAAALLLLTAVIATATVLLFMRHGKSAPPSLALSALDLGGQLQIAWDRDAAAVRGATGGSLEIVDGDKRLVLPVTAAGLKRGSVTYARSSGNVEVRLTVNPLGSSPVEELVTFVGSKPAATPKPEASQPEESQPKVEDSPPPPAAKPKPVERRRERKKKKGRERAEVIEPPRRAEPAARLRLGKSATQPKVRPFGQPPSLGPGAQAEVAKAAIPIPRSETAAAPPPAAPAPRPADAKPGYSGPISGRLIWTGRLARGRSVSINGSQASTGYLTGELPGVPVRISAQPAELSDNGMVVYTARAAAARREPPGPLNGWNSTEFELDPNRAARVLVTEPPNAQTGWRKLTLRSDEAPVAVVVIDWKVAE